MNVSQATDPDKAPDCANVVSEVHYNFKSIELEGKCFNHS